jgi:hypothetical protein
LRAFAFLAVEGDEPAGEEVDLAALAGKREM